MRNGVADVISRGSDIRCCAPRVQKHREGIDEHPETLKTCRRSAIGTRDRAIIGNRSALMDRYRSSFPLRSLFFLFYPSLQMTWKNAEEDEEDEEDGGRAGQGRGGEGEGREEVAEKRVLTTLPQNMVAITAGD
ncbi:hypothetical protein PUN28_018505 [Cardiocondyla obscurior]|uniref:Uncharacterized protein n=1 Tax=Cardiocondyla obscurior TaxID=286306 RepID=A0AAW2EJK0_9HYME